MLLLVQSMNPSKVLPVLLDMAQLLMAASTCIQSELYSATPAFDPNRAASKDTI